MTINKKTTKKKDWIYPANKVLETPKNKGDYNPETGQFCYNPIHPAWTASTPGVQKLFKPGKWEELLCIMGNSYPSGEDALETLTEGFKRLEPPKQTLRPALSNFPVEGPPPNWLINESFWKRGTTWLLNADTGAGKSTLMVNMMVPWCQGKEWMGLRPNGPLKFLVANGENDEDDIGRLLTMYLKASGLADDEVALSTINKNIQFLDRPRICGLEFFDEIRKHLRDFQADILIIDPLMSFVDRIGGGEAADSFRNFVRFQLEELLEQFNLGAIVTHHMNKQTVKDDLGAFSGSGTSDIANSARLVSNLRKVEDKEDVVELRWFKRLTTTAASNGEYTDRLYLKKSGYEERVWGLHVEEEEDEGIIDLGKSGKIDIMDALMFLYTWIDAGHRPMMSRVKEELMDKYGFGDPTARRLVGQLKNLGYLERWQDGKAQMIGITQAGYTFIGKAGLTADVIDGPF